MLATTQKELNPVCQWCCLRNGHSQWLWPCQMAIPHILLQDQVVCFQLCPPLPQCLGHGLASSKPLTIYLLIDWPTHSLKPSSRGEAIEEAEAGRVCLCSVTGLPSSLPPTRVGQPSLRDEDVDFEPLPTQALYHKMRTRFIYIYRCSLNNKHLITIVLKMKYFNVKSTCCLEIDTTEGRFIFWSKTHVSIQPPSRGKTIHSAGLGRGLLKESASPF